MLRNKWNKEVEFERPRRGNVDSAIPENQDLADPSYEIGGWFNVVMFLSRRSNNQVWIS